MAQNTELQERYSSLVLAKQRATSLFANLFNRSYEGTPTAGAVKIPVRDTEVVAGSNYNTLTGASLTAAATSYKTLVIDKDNYVNELIDGHTADAVPDGLVAERLDSAGYSMGIATDSALRDCLLTEGTSFGTTTALTKDTVYEKVIDARTALRKAHIMTSEMWMAVSPETYALLLKSPEFIRASSLGDEVIATGAVGMIGGIVVYEYDNYADDKVEFILGNSVYCHYVDDWKVPVAIKDLADGAHIGSSAIQGRDVYGCMVSRPATVLVKKKA